MLFLFFVAFAFAGRGGAPAGGDIGAGVGGFLGAKGSGHTRGGHGIACATGSGKSDLGGGVGGGQAAGLGGVVDKAGAIVIGEVVTCGRVCDVA